MAEGSGRREQIIAIATRLIASRGYSSTTVRDIADEAGILSGSLYHHFSSKEAVLHEILRTFQDDTLSAFEAIAASGAHGVSARERLDQLIEHSYRTIEERPDDVRIYQNETGFLMTQPGFEYLAEGAVRIEELWLAQIIEGQSSGVFRDTLDPPLVFRFIRDAVWSTVFWYRPGGRHTAASIGRNTIDLLHHGLLAAEPAAEPADAHEPAEGGAADADQA